MTAWTHKNGCVHKREGGHKNYHHRHTVTTQYQFHKNLWAVVILRRKYTEFYFYNGTN